MLEPDVMVNAAQYLVDPIKRAGGDIFYHLFVGREVSKKGQAYAVTRKSAPRLVEALARATMFRFQYEENEFQCGQMATGRYLKIAT